MASYALQTMGGPLTNLVSSDKGSIGNRLEATGAQIGNNVVTTAKAAAVVAGAGVAGYGIVKCPTLADAAAKVADTFTNSAAKICNKTGLKELWAQTTGKITNFCSKLSPQAKKGLALVGLVALPIVAYIGRNHIYKSGQIDQKYTDKAQLQKNQIS